MRCNWGSLRFLMPLHPLTNFEVKKYYQNKRKFKGVYYNLHKIKDGAYVINLSDYKSIGTHWVTIFKSDLEGTIGIDTSNFDKEAALASLKSVVNRLDIDELGTTPVDLSKLSDVVKNEVVKKIGYDELVFRLLILVI